MGGEDIALGREVGAAEAVEPGLVGGGEGEGEDQRRRVGRRLKLTRVILPGMAVAQRWPIRLDHCFMRVLLDNVVGVWHRVIARLAIRHIGAEPAQPGVAAG